jgi:hypothetical protein
MTPDDVGLRRSLTGETPALKFRTLKKASADVHSE